MQSVTLTGRFVCFSRDWNAHV